MHAVRISPRAGPVNSARSSRDSVLNVRVFAGFHHMGLVLFAARAPAAAGSRAAVLSSSEVLWLVYSSGGTASNFYSCPLILVQSTAWPRQTGLCGEADQRWKEEVYSVSCVVV